MTETPGTTSFYWDCECAEHFIHPKGCKECLLCGAVPENQPDSHLIEVHLMMQQTVAGARSRLAHRCDHRKGVKA